MPNSFLQFDWLMKMPFIETLRETERETNFNCEPMIMDLFLSYFIVFLAAHRGVSNVLKST